MNTMTYKGYTAQVGFDEDGGVFFGTVRLPSTIITFDADTVAGLVRVFHEDIDDYLADCAETGKKPEKSASGRLMLRVPPAVHCAALSAAKASGESLNQWATKALASAASA
jgi:predicted HicB family RNase H-like nuclease